VPVAAKNVIFVARVCQFCYGINSSLGIARPASSFKILQIDACCGCGLPSGVKPEASTLPYFRRFPLFCALFFPLFAIVLAPADFATPAQRLAL
jgi:hypothetical protein